MSNKTYDILKYIAQIVLPALGSLYFGLSQIWGLPYGEEIVGTITLIDTFLGALLKISSNNYNKKNGEWKLMAKIKEETLKELSNGKGEPDD